MQGKTRISHSFRKLQIARPVDIYMAAGSQVRPTQAKKSEKTNSLRYLTAFFFSEIFVGFLF